MVNTAPNLSQPVAFRTIAIRFTNPTVVSAELACPRELTTEVTTMTLRLQGVTGTATEHPALFRHSAWAPSGRTESYLCEQRLYHRRLATSQLLTGPSSSTSRPICATFPCTPRPRVRST